MAGLEALTAMIYHERQQPGSMLCAQHALNSLLQGNYFTAPDLASIAHTFDALEQGTLDEESRHSSSTNMDDTGFFSVQVMDKALEVWGLSLVRWRSEQMRPYQASPHTQLAFVLNLHQHWFTLRRFGPARTSFADDPGLGHWFNLNSAYTAPKWVSRTYLSMFLRQSEEEGYSVFAVVQTDPSRSLALPRTEADTIAATVDAPDSAPDHSSASSSTPGNFSEAQEQVVIPEDVEYVLESEDVELQAALQASLTGKDYSNQNTYTPREPIPAPNLRPAPPPPIIASNHNVFDVLDADNENNLSAEQNPPQDQVAASMARQRAMLNQMMRAQEAALRETYEEEVASRRETRQQRGQTAQEEEDEEIRRAIAASLDEHEVESRDDGDDSYIDDEDQENIPPQGQRRRSARTSSRNAPDPPQTTIPGHRVYDDEDAELQAALRASLETMPAGYVHPETPPPQRPPLPSISSPEPNSALVTTVSQTTVSDDEDDATERFASPPPIQQAVDVDEMRRRRLARFGG